MLTLILSLGLYVPQTAWLRHFMRKHSELLGDIWTDTNINIEDFYLIDEYVKYPMYFKEPLHGFQDGGMCKYQALYQSPSMRYIMRMFQGNPLYREVSMTKEINSFIETYSQQDKELVSLDIGCGTGDSTLVLDECLCNFNNRHVIGVDLSANMISLAQLHETDNRHFFRMDAGKLEIPSNSIDLITSFALFHEMPRKYSLRVLNECLRVLKPNGQLMVWDQLVTEESAKRQYCRGAPPIEPFLLSYSKLNITKWMKYLI